MPRRRLALACLVGLAVLLAGAAGAVPVGAAVTPSALSADVQAAAAVATAQDYRTGVAVLDLATGQYDGAGDDTGSFASESVAKVLIATELLATGQMTGSTETTAYQMITQSDDDDADALYGLAGGDDVINLVAARYDIPFLGTAPKQSGWWGNTEINAKGMVYLYAAIAKDPVVGPWLMNAMANTTEYGEDGTYQYFGIPSATTGAAIKQGWGDDGDDSPNAVFNSTGYVNGDKYAVAILTDGDSSTYGDEISNMVTSEARALMPTGQLDDPVAHNPSITVTATASGNTVHLTGTAADPDTSAALAVQVDEGTTRIATGTTTDGRYDLAFTAPDGTHIYTVTTPNVGEGTAVASATAPALKVDGDPTGTVSSVLPGRGQIVVSGVVANPNSTPRVEVAVSGSAPVVVAATRSGAAAASFTTAAKASAFDVTVPADGGTRQVTVTYLGSDGAPDVPAGTWTVDVAQTKSQVRAADRRTTLAITIPSALLIGALGLLGLVWRRRHTSSTGNFVSTREQ